MRTYDREQVQQTKTTWKLLNEGRFTAAMKYKEGKSKATARAMWASAISNPQVWSGLVDGELVVAYKKPLSVEDIRKVTNKLTVEGNAGSFLSKDAVDALHNDMPEDEISKFLAGGLGDLPNGSTVCAASLVVLDVAPTASVQPNAKRWERGGA